MVLRREASTVSPKGYAGSNPVYGVWHGRPSGLRRRTANPVFRGFEPRPCLISCRIVQLVEHLILTQKVAGSSPAAVVQGFSVMEAQWVLIPYE